MSRRVAINLVAFLGVFFLMMWWAVNNIITFDFLEKPYAISGEFAATAGVAGGSEVAYLGVNYGSVRSVDLVDENVRIVMDIQRDKQIPAGSIARVFRKSAVGEPYIDFAPPEDYDGEGGPYIEPGEVIPLDRTQVPLEFSELLRAASRVLESVDPEQTRTLVHELAVALQGRGQKLRDLTVSSDALLQTFADRTELLDSLSENSTRLTRTVAARRGSLGSSIEDLAALAESLRAAEPNVRVLLDRGTELLDQTGDLVADVKGELDCVLHDLQDVVELASSPQNIENTRITLERAPEAFNFVWLARDTEPGGVWVRTHLLAEFSGEPAEMYVPPHELPKVPEVPACVSPFNSDSADGPPGGGDEVAAGGSAGSTNGGGARSAAGGDGDDPAEPAGTADRSDDEVAARDTVDDSEGTSSTPIIPALVLLAIAVVVGNIVLRLRARS